MLKFNKIKYISHLLIILILAVQLIPRHEANISYSKAVPVSNISIEQTVLNSINLQYQQVVNKFLQYLYYSFVSIVNDKFDVIPEKISTDSRKIYSGSFSYLNRYSTFLTAQFATST